MYMTVDKHTEVFDTGHRVLFERQGKCHPIDGHHLHDCCH